MAFARALFLNHHTRHPMRMSPTAPIPTPMPTTAPCDSPELCADSEGVAVAGDAVGRVVSANEPPVSVVVLMDEVRSVACQLICIRGAMMSILVMTMTEVVAEDVPVGDTVAVTVWGTVTKEYLLLVPAEHWTVG